MATANVHRYSLPQSWVRYDKTAIFDRLVEAKTAAAVLRQLPHLPQWIEAVHQEQLRLEAAGTSRIEGAEFTPQEEAEALSPAAANRSDLTYSQRQLRAAEATYQWIASLPSDLSVNAGLILDIHRRIVTGCEDDHCEPGATRRDGHNVTFGLPQCRGVEGGSESEEVFARLCTAISGEFRDHDEIVQAMAAHYHIGAMHPFGDGNGRTARALEAFMLRKAGVNDRVMVSLSNYYYARKDEYLGSLYESRHRGHDLTPFLQFALRGITERCNAVASEILENHQRILFREFARSLFGQLRSPRRRVLADRQLQMLETLLDSGPMDAETFFDRTLDHYRGLKHQSRAQLRDVVELIRLNAVLLDDETLRVNLQWPQEVSQSDLIERYERMPSAVSANHPAMPELSRLLRGRR